MTAVSKHQNDELYALRHSAAHVLASAVLDLFPSARLGIGPPTADGFYYDFDLDEPLTAEVIDQIEQRMKEIIEERGKTFDYREVSPDEARTLYRDQPYKLELIEDILSRGTDEYGNASETNVLSTYSIGKFEDLCRGPHVTAIDDIDPNAIKLLRTSAAYWRGNEKRPSMQRIYGTVWRNDEELEKFLWEQEEAKKRDHRRFGEDLDLFSFSPDVGRGLPLWLPNGAVIREELERWAKETERLAGYKPVYTPHIARSELYKISGHLPYYADDLYSPIEIDGDEYYLKPMNCPHHHMVYKARPHSYRELPLRYAEYGTVYRYEKSGELFGLLRVRGFTQNDAHIYCTLEQSKAEFVAVMRMHDYYYRTLGIENFHMVLAMRDPANTDKYHGDDEMWETAERITRAAMEESEIPFIEELGGAAHYGPKVDFILRSAVGREFAASTNQLDLYMPGRFDLTYVDSDQASKHVAVIHRAPLGSHERFTGFLIEHFAAAFPAWLSPVQVKILPVADGQLEYVEAIAQRFLEAGYRADVDHSGESVGAQIRKASMEKVPYALVVGKREQAANTVSVRARGGVDLGVMSVDAFIEQFAKVVASRSLGLEFD